MISKASMKIHLTCVTFVPTDPAAADVAATLVDFGFSESQARAAAARCSSVEAAMDWLTKHLT